MHQLLVQYKRYIVETLIDIIARRIQNDFFSQNHANYIYLYLYSIMYKRIFFHHLFFISHNYQCVTPLPIPILYKSDSIIVHTPYSYKFILRAIFI